jgi:hypothetical protein
VWQADEIRLAGDESHGGLTMMEPGDFADDLWHELLSFIPVPPHDMPQAEIMAKISEKFEEAIGELD